MYLDVEHWRPVQRVQPDDLQHVALDALNPDGGHSDGVGAAWAADSEHPPEGPAGVAPGVHLQVVTGGPVEIEEHDDVAAGSQAQKALGQRRVEHDAGWPRPQFVTRQPLISSVPFHVTDWGQGNGLEFEVWGLCVVYFYNSLSNPVISLNCLIRSSISFTWPWMLLQ